MEQNPCPSYDNNGIYLIQFGKLGACPGEFELPEHVAFDEKDDKGTILL